MLKGKEGAGPKLKDFKAYVDSNDVPEIAALKHDVEEFAKEFPTIGFEKARARRAAYAPARLVVAACPMPELGFREGRACAHHA